MNKKKPLNPTAMSNSPMRGCYEREEFQSLSDPSRRISHRPACPTLITWNPKHKTVKMAVFFAKEAEYGVPGYTFIWGGCRGAP